MEKICLLGYMNVHGGIQRNIVNISDRLCKKYDVYILNFDNEGTIPYVVNGNVKVLSLSANNHFDELLKLKKAFDKIQPDIVIGFWLLNAVWSVLLKFLYHYKVIYSERNDPSNKEYGYLLRVVRYIGFRFVDRFVFQHKSARDFFNRKIAERSVIIANAVELHNIKPKESYSENISRFITVGRLHPQKNQLLMIEAFYELIKENNRLQNITLDIYGDGKLKDFLQSEIRRYKMDLKIKIHPAQKNIYEIMRDYDVFILTSNYEGMPNVLLEAMSLGLTCISTNYSCGGVDEIISNNLNGIIINNDKKELKDAIKYLCDNSKNCANMGKKAVAISKDHSMDVIMLKWENVIKDVLG